MKKTLVVGLAIGLVSLAAGAAFAGKSAFQTAPAPGYAGQKNTGGTGIVGSSHDLSAVKATLAAVTSAKFAGATVDGQTGAVTSTADVQSRICVYCHHPHNAYSATGSNTGALSYSPLWNREMSTRNYTGYDNGIMMGGEANNSDKQHALNASNHGGTALGGVSLLCMSCHDGVVAMNAYSQTTGSASTKGNTAKGGPITGTAAFTTNLNNHHPMGFNYQAVANADSEIAQPSQIMTGSVTIGDLLYGEGTMECVTCHDVHNTLNQSGAERFLWKSNNQSNFCLTCHLK